MVLKLTPLVRPAIDVDFATLEEMVKGMFQSRRKVMRMNVAIIHVMYLNFVQMYLLFNEPTSYHQILLHYNYQCLAG